MSSSSQLQHSPTVLAILALLAVAALFFRLDSYEERADALAARIDALATPDKAAPKEPEKEEIELADLMGDMALRVANLWFAAQSGNKDLSKYEIHELEEIYEELESAKPMEENIDVAAQMKSVLMSRIPALEKAIEASDKAAFESTYDEMLKGCNACHVMTNHGFVRITLPRETPQVNRAFE